MSKRNKVAYRMAEEMIAVVGAIDPDLTDKVQNYRNLDRQDRQEQAQISRDAFIRRKCGGRR